MPSAQNIASKLAYITGQLNAGGTNAQMKEWYFEYKKLNEELEEAKAEEAKVKEATAPDTTAEGTLETTAPETTAKGAPETTAPETTAEASQTKARKVTFEEPYDHGSPDEG